jgi:hypothetical protein
VAYEVEFDEFLTDTVTYEPFVSLDGFGAKVYGPALNVKARVEQQAKLVRDATGREVVSNTQLFMKPTATDGSSYTPTVQDRITLSAGYSPQAPPPIAVERVNDNTGLHHFEVSL